MLYHFLISFIPTIPALNVFRYITFRTGGAILTALILSFILGPKLIKWLKQKQKEGQPIREDGPQSHLVTKKGTPTMGGVLIVFSIIMSTLLWADLCNHYVWISLFVTLGFGFLGAFDDYLKLTRRSSKGLPGKLKLLAQILLSTTVALWITQVSGPSNATGLALPFIKDFFLNLGWFFIPWAIIVISGASNAVNLTDGLDGLAIMPVMIAGLCFFIISYVVGHHVFSNYLHLNFIPGSGELSIVCGALIGASLGFLWFNAPPALVFMGDTGSLAVGALLGTVSIITKHEIVLSIIGGLFVVEALSVMIQVFYFKLTGKRVFLMAPIHHHFEQKGWAESTIVVRFWIIAVILALVGLSTLKLR